MPTKPSLPTGEWRAAPRVWGVCQGAHSQRRIERDMFISEVYANLVLFPSLWSTVTVHIILWEDLEHLTSALSSDTLRLLSVTGVSSWPLNLKDLGDECWEHCLPLSVQSLSYSAVTVNSTQPSILWKESNNWTLVSFGSSVGVSGRDCVEYRLTWDDWARHGQHSSIGRCPWAV